ncbi:unnamed protein product [Protopolystoma xenopodis]|uniref:Uncharacterized protein n=1 Tax=Protopolystoma xenopodis TaxID=117903 RepID=A0A3S5BAC1_9PLAT|nr:unnamed protein product [Protopolystoma xenopodis]
MVRVHPGLLIRPMRGEKCRPTWMGKAFGKQCRVRFDGTVSRLLSLLPFRVKVLREETRKSVPQEEDGGFHGDQLSIGFAVRFMVTLFPRQSPSIPSRNLFSTGIEGDCLLKQRQHESSSKANRQLVKRNPPSCSGGTDLRISSPNTFIRNGSSET